MNLALTLCDEHSNSVLFRPYYFNHIMALQVNNNSLFLTPIDKFDQMTSCAVLVGPTDETLLPGSSKGESFFISHGLLQILVGSKTTWTE